MSLTSPGRSCAYAASRLPTLTANSRRRLLPASNPPPTAIARSTHMDHITKLENSNKAADLARAERRRFANGYLLDKTTRENVDTDLKERGHDADTILAESFVSGLAPLEAIERMLASAELRRSNALWEID